MAVSFVLILVSVFHGYVSGRAAKGMLETNRHFFPFLRSFLI